MSAGLLVAALAAGCGASPGSNNDSASKSRPALAASEERVRQSPDSARATMEPGVSAGQ